MADPIPVSKATTEHVEQLNGEVSSQEHTEYNDKDVRRTYNDGEDHEHEPSMTFKRMMSLIAMAFRE